MEESGGLRISGDPPLGQPYTSEFYSIKLFSPHTFILNIRENPWCSLQRKGNNFKICQRTLVFSSRPILREPEPHPFFIPQMDLMHLEEKHFSNYLAH